MGFGAMKFIQKSSIMMRLYPSYRAEIVTFVVGKTNRRFAHPTRLPSRQPFFGREEELEHIAEALHPD